MNAEAHTSNRWLTNLIWCVILMPIIYAASSGPVLLFASKLDDHGAAYLHALHFYRPLLRTAVSTHLDPPLSAYFGLFHLHTFKIVGKTGTGPGTMAIVPPDMIY